jgi:hypothetical protein
MLGILKLGLAGLQVLELIGNLRQLGFEPEGENGSVFNKAVQMAVMAFQATHVGPNMMPLKIDGEVGPLTKWALDVALGTIAAPAIASAAAPTDLDRPAGVSDRAWNAVQVARAELGHGEHGGDNRGPDVMKYHAVTCAAAGDSWCASFVSYCFQHGNPGNTPYEPTAGARETLRRFEKRGWVYKASLASPPLPGDILVFWREQVSGWKGHIGIVDAYEHGIVTTIEGNKGSFPSVVRRYQYTFGQIDKLLGWGRVP